MLYTEAIPYCYSLIQTVAAQWRSVACSIACLVDQPVGINIKLDHHIQLLKDSLTMSVKNAHAPTSGAIEATLQDKNHRQTTALRIICWEGKHARQATQTLVKLRVGWQTHPSRRLNDHRNWKQNVVCVDQTYSHTSEACKGCMHSIVCQDLAVYAVARSCGNGADQVGGVDVLHICLFEALLDLRFKPGSHVFKDGVAAEICLYVTC